MQHTPSPNTALKKPAAFFHLGRRVLPRGTGSLSGEPPGEEAMPRYMVERRFPQGLQIPVNDAGATTCLAVVQNNADLGVTWIHSYVSEDKAKTFCIYDGPTPEAIQRAAERSGLPVECITKVSVLDPYFYK
jgi:hypothetical protein